MPGKRELMIERGATDPTSGSLQGEADVTGTSLRKRFSEGRRGTLVVPGKRELMIERGATDPTSGSLRSKRT
ncbi:hypothetical protein THTE_0516 [Thermogutta terrifontis]|uniref:Uncharacterized protein n=1 Tax=Thermogutta terrifontis TaxID=1331910 RepID=A0A286RAY7_9BACT|nr:hypothetical protein THTE_0516 [Thermogutta terrifontis]